MSETEEITILKEQLKSEQELILKLKTLVIKEKKNGANLSAEVERLTLKFEELQHENSLLRTNLNESQPIPVSNDIVTDLEERIKSAERELQVRTTQLDQKNSAFSQLSDELDDLIIQLTNSKERERNSNLLIEQLKSELSTVYEQLVNFKNEEKSFQNAVSREKDLLTQLDELNNAYEECNELHQKQLKDLEERESDTRRCLAIQKANNKELADTLSRFRHQLGFQTGSFSPTSGSSGTPVTLVEATQTRVTLSQDCASGWDKLHSDLSALDKPTLLNICRECLTQLKPFSETIKSDQSEIKCLLDLCTEFLSSGNSTGWRKGELEKESSNTVMNILETCTLQDKEKTQCPLPSNQMPHSPTINSVSQYYDPPDKAYLSSSCIEEAREPDGQTDRTDDTNRLQMLEVKVNDLEKYAAEQEDRVKLQQIDWTQKLEIQAADYDHLIRDKETEISELRETCDRLSEEVLVFANFCSSTMVLIGEKASTSIDEKNTDWMAVADALNSSENHVSGYELNGLLEALYRDIQILLDSVANPNVDPMHDFPDKQSFVEPNDSSYELDEVKAQLAVTVNSLDEANKRASDAEATVAELQDELQKRDDKINCMKKLLIRLKMDASEQQKTKAVLEDTESTKQSLMDELEDRTKEVVQLTGEKEQVESALLLAREEAYQLRVTADSLREERDSVLRRFNRLQSEYGAYKVKAVHTLRNSHVISSPPSTTLKSDHPSVKSMQLDESTINTNSVVQGLDLEQLNHQLVTAQQRAEEASLRASIARTECDLAKEELTDIRHKYSDLLNEFRSQREVWESKLDSLTRERQQETVDRIKELEEKLAVARTQYDEQLRGDQARQQRLLSDERALWTAKLDKALEENKLLQEELDSLHRNLNSYISLMSSAKGINSIQTQNLELSVLSPNQPRGRMQGDGADNVTDEFDAPYESGSGSRSLQDGRRKRSAHRPLVLPLEQLLSSPNTSIPTVTPSGSSSDSPRVSRQHSGDLSGNDVIVSSGSVSSQISGLRVALSKQQRRVEHLSELLNESEANVARLEEQAKVLKEEIRRLERITARESQFVLSSSTVSTSIDPVSSSNESSVKDAHLRTEYLKNVILKLVCSAPDSAERPQLAAVLSSLLMLSPPEQKTLQDGILSAQYNSHSSTAASSWTSYLTGWTSPRG
ncbi:hypothetical protein D915_002771 [Fasciola hepatica]|uniref:GRIP domain-containing protein n=1 Tax=Fasciola hepatica TaxID=6192 RepID=A0A4E0S1F1_FASHE|nr:hypothetical protein D915_002771 [Fasciola hepatica]